VKLTILSHDLSSNAAMRAHRLATAAATFAAVELIGPVEPEGIWPALPNESWIRPVPKTRFPQFMQSFLDLAEAADGDVLLAVKPHLASFGVALVAAERRSVPVVLDFDDLDLALAPRSAWNDNPAMTDLSRPGSAVYVSLLTKCAGAASAITVASKALQQRFGGTLIRHGCDTTRFDPALVDREQARLAFGFRGPTVLFPGAPRAHKGLDCLARAIQEIPDARLVVTCRPDDLADEEWKDLPLSRIPLVPYSSLPTLLAAADVIAVPQLDTEAASYQTPMKIFEAMAMAKPIVTTTVGDLPAIVEGCGRLVAPGNADQLSSAILGLLGAPREAEALGERARTRCIREFSLENTAGQLTKIFRQVDPDNAFHYKRTDREAVFASGTVDVPVLVPPEILSDLALPFLSRALDPTEFRAELAGTSQSIIDEPAEVRSIHVLRYKPSRRCLIEYHLQSTGPDSRPFTLLGKVSARASSRKYDIQRAFWSAGFQDTSTDGISVPKPLGMIPHWHLWLQRKVSGSSATSLLEQHDAPALVARLADALTKIHLSGVATDRTHTLGDEIDTLHHRIGKVIARNPQRRSRLERILARCTELAAVIPESPLTGIHRDFYADQMIFNGERVYLLDFDLYAAGDPALDAGNFLGHLTEQSLRKWGHPDALSTCEQAFQERFLQRSHGSKEEAVQAYAVLTLVRHIFLGSQFRERLHYGDMLVDLCERHLELALRACRRTTHMSGALMPD
jgi:glycosyltransferase involved in cell wall biosynthesis